MSTIATPVPKLNYRSLVARSIRMLNVAGVMHMSGHVALRDLEEPHTFWINSRKASRSTITVNDIVQVDLLTGKRLTEGDEPPSEFHIHRAIFNRRADVNAIVHTHPDHVIALSLAGIVLAPVHVTGAFLPAKTPVFDDPNLINKEHRGEALADALGDASTVVLRGHGIVVTAGDIEAVVTRTVCAEENARMQYLAASVGMPKAMEGEELEVAAREWNVPIIMRKHWHYHEETAKRLGALEGVDG
jgi:ribulose-5-phosphate 4-epimerase/fuculose-1-phosphate aldolase